MSGWIPPDVSKVLAAGSSYFLAVFTVGFALGVVRTLWLLPALGERWAELVELPFMVAASFVAARAVSRFVGLPEAALGARIAAGIVALGLLLSVELTLVLWLRGLTLAEYTASRDPVSGSAYVVSLLLFAAMPTLVTLFARRNDRAEGRAIR